MPVSQTEDLQRELNALREQLLDLGEELTSLRTENRAWKQALVHAFRRARLPVPGCLQDQPPPARGPLLTVITGDGPR